MVIFITKIEVKQQISFYKNCKELDKSFFYMILDHKQRGDNAKI